MVIRVDGSRRYTYDLVTILIIEGIGFHSKWRKTFQSEDTRVPSRCK